jgi:hypothetical protein
MKQDVMRNSRHGRYPLLYAAVGVWAILGPQSFGATEFASCAANPESRRLDFWLGKWTIAGPDGSLSATSRVHLALDKCMVVESWSGGQGHEGENMFAYSQDDHSWHGMFTDNEGRMHVFVDGKVASGSAVFSGPSRGPNDETLLNRISITRAGHDRVEQLWQKSADNGVTWSTEFRGEYSRRSR